MSFRSFILRGVFEYIRMSFVSASVPCQYFIYTIYLVLLACSLVAVVLCAVSTVHEVVLTLSTCWSCINAYVDCVFDRIARMVPLVVTVMLKHRQILCSQWSLSEVVPVCMLRCDLCSFSCRYWFLGILLNLLANLSAVWHRLRFLFHVWLFLSGRNIYIACTQICGPLWPVSVASYR